MLLDAGGYLGPAMANGETPTPPLDVEGLGGIGGGGLWPLESTSEAPSHVRLGAWITRANCCFARTCCLQRALTPARHTTAFSCCAWEAVAKLNARAMRIGHDFRLVLPTRHHRPKGLTYGHASRFDCSQQRLHTYAELQQCVF